MQAHSTGEPELLQAQRRRREQREADRASASGSRRPRRRRHSAPWLQRNALSVAAISVLIAFLGLGFGLLQMLNRPEPSNPALSLAQSELAAPTTSSNSTGLTAAVVGPSVQVGALVPGAEANAPRAHAIQSSAKVLDPNYTIVAGDTLVKIANRFNTSVQRIQAFNNLDPRALKIGAKLIIPPPL